jgi:hypothetical protein
MLQGGRSAEQANAPTTTPDVLWLQEFRHCGERAIELRAGARTGLPGGIDCLERTADACRILSGPGASTLSPFSTVGRRAVEGRQHWGRSCGGLQDRFWNRDVIHAFQHIAESLPESASGHGAPFVGAGGLNKHRVTILVAKHKQD